ncbi:DUF397 domain-containing protein [Dactylosporangium sp. NPDC000244]|uniref:DUF397 domain-containing protein n=1 Tax=Dactylosporangium sp. NPDC000244 TaxID=3154365 RepID=UPI00332615C9
MHERVRSRGWRRSSASINGNCVEFARDGREVLVRDSKAPDGAVLRFSGESWSRFVRAVAGGGL